MGRIKRTPEYWKKWRREYMRKKRAEGKFSNKGAWARMSEYEKTKRREGMKRWYVANAKKKRAYQKVYFRINRAVVLQKQREREKRKKEGKKDA